VTTIAAAPPMPRRRVVRARRREGGTFRRLALAASVIALPLQDHVPPIAGFSIVYLAFALLALIAVFTQPRALMRAASNRVFIAAYALLLVTLLVEALHTGPTFIWWGRMAQMVAGGVIIAALCRTERDIDAVLTGLIIAGLWVAFIIARSTAGLGAASAVGFHEVSMLRGALLGEMGLRANWNTLAFICVGAAGVAATRAVLARNSMRFVYAGAALATVFATFLTFSRSGAASLMVVLGYVFYALMNREMFLRLALVVIATILVVALAVPSVVFERFTFSLDYDATGRRESRAMVYSTVIREIPDYIALGVGEGNFWNVWAIEHGLEAQGETIGAHNCPLQILLYWGMPGLLCWLALLFVAWRTLRNSSRHNLHRVALKAFCLSVFMSSLASHDLSDKEFSMALGMIVGAFALHRRAMVARHHRRVMAMRKAAA